MDFVIKQQPLFLKIMGDRLLSGKRKQFHKIILVCDVGVAIKVEFYKNGEMFQTRKNYEANRKHLHFI